MTPFINIHTHRQADRDSIAIRNLMNPDTMEEELDKDGYFSIGIHPWHIHPDHWQEDLETVTRLASHPRVLAIGEAGLDRLTDLPLSLQQEVFAAMANLAESAAKPLIIHAVRTYSEIGILHSALRPGQPWIVHGFNSRMSIAAGLKEKGIIMSFGQALLRGDQPAAVALKSMKDGCFFLETDEAETPIAAIYERAAELLDITKEQLMTDIYHSFTKLFRHGAA